MSALRPFARMARSGLSATKSYETRSKTTRAAVAALFYNPANLISVVTVHQWTH